MAAVCNYFKGSIKNLSTKELGSLHDDYVCNKAKACMTRVFTISLLALSILTILSGNFALGIGFGALAIGLGTYDLIQSYKLVALEKILQERGLQATYQIYNWGWGGFSSSAG
ncbi:MAG: hypothetical protein HZB76_06425 [Chlamydiae bacterium]|nr:hypothetical protein [Chlamydiota bacterium]